MGENGNDNGIDRVGVIEALQLLFLGLKLSGHLPWSWWWVFTPLLSKLGIMVLVGVIGAAISAKQRQ